ncbi:PAS domain-containing protein [Streptomyces fagopyri]|uniref:PAS domain-containing protein n=1 Tax=Streptomyces fagopyri TaxID=2662397 RepID=UPI0034059EE8
MLSQTIHEVKASVGQVYLLPPGERVLRLAVMSGMSRDITAPWARAGLEAPIPVSDAVRERRLVWVGGREEMARRYPKVALVLPYPFTVAASPITTGTRTWGGLVLLWPGSHPPQLALEECHTIRAWCLRLALLLQQASDRGNPVLPGFQPRVLPGLRTPSLALDEARAGAEFAERLPEGCCALNLEGRITYVTATAARLVRVDRTHLLGARPCDALPWLDNLLFEDRYRAAVVSGQPTFFTALCPPDQRLSFHLYPDASGLSIRITTSAAPTRHDPDVPATPQPPPPTIRSQPVSL